MVTTTEVWPNGMPQVGQTARRSRLVTAHDIELFTRLSGDRNPLHYDADLAAGTPFGGIIVQGGVTSAILNAVVAQELPGPGTVFLEVNWRFTAPVRPGETITGEVVVTSVREDKPVSELDTRVLLADGSAVLEGHAVCYTMPLGNERGT
jgi:acyl dehydratase